MGWGGGRLQTHLLNSIVSISKHCPGIWHQKGGGGIDLSISSCRELNDLLPPKVYTEGGGLGQGPFCNGSQTQVSDKCGKYSISGVGGWGGSTLKANEKRLLLDSVTIHHSSPEAPCMQP